MGGDGGSGGMGSTMATLLSLLPQLHPRIHMLSPPEANLLGERHRQRGYGGRSSSSSSSSSSCGISSIQHLLGRSLVHVGFGVESKAVNGPPETNKNKAPSAVSATFEGKGEYERRTTPASFPAPRADSGATAEEESEQLVGWLRAELARRKVGSSRLMGLMDNDRSSTASFQEFQHGLECVDVRILLIYDELCVVAATVMG